MRTLEKVLENLYSHKLTIGALILVAVVLTAFEWIQGPEPRQESAQVSLESDPVPGDAPLAQRRQDLAEAVKTLLENQAQPASPLVARFRTELRRYYVERQGIMLWTPARNKDALIAHLERVDEDGLSPDDYPIGELQALRAGASGADARKLAEAELEFSAAFLAYASDLRVGRLNPRKVDPELFAQTKSIDGAEALDSLVERGDLAVFAGLWAPHNPEYRALRSLLSDHREIAAAGGWPTLTPGTTLKPGMRDPAVAVLRQRLRASRDITVESADPQFYDPALEMAVKRFQGRHGLETDGIVGRNTRAALNVPVHERIAQILLNMERWRWLPEDLGDRYILVNIAGFSLTLVESGSVQERMRVVVGKPYRRTPVFSDRIQYLEFNPYWTVPHSLAVEDKLPKLKANPSVLRTGGFEVFRNGKPVSPRDIDWTRLSRTNFPYTLRQKPGPKNALGRVKFMFPNEFAVYLHDTPSQALFERASRAFSSGCIRLERPLDLAAAVLEESADWDRQRIEAVLASGKNTRAPLANHLPVHLTYATAWSGEGGTIHFRPDVYGRDESLHEALFGQRPSIAHAGE